MQLTDTGILAVLQSYKYNAPILGALGAVITPAAYSQTGATVSFTLQRATGMTQLNLGANTQFVNTNLVTLEVTLSIADPVSRQIIIFHSRSHAGVYK